MNSSAHVGPWTLHKRLGAGGNAKVWEATREGSGDRVALKVIEAKRPTREPYKRFVQEITVLRSLGDPPGVLPVLDSYLPEKPSADDRPWLAMPIARTLSEALAEADLETVVEAIAQIAETLARLAQEHQLGHRDIKPDNLYELDGSWLVGDFGLVAAPDLEELTRSGRIGAAHYTPYEMIENPANADPHPADVYALAKTLWVLATGQRYPPEGQQAANTRGFGVGDFKPHRHAAALDRLIEAATRIHPEERPSMIQMARDLRSWQELAEETPALDLSDAAAQLRKKLAIELAATERSASNKEEAFAAIRRLQELTAPLNAELRALHPNTEIDAMDDKFTNSMLRTMTETGAREIEHRWSRCTRVPTGPEYSRYSLRMGRGIELTSDGALIFRAFVDVGRPSLGGNDFFWQSQERESPVGSIEADRMLQEGVAEVGEQLRKAVEVFVEKVPGES